ncbi:hypothetical protein K458DRAFT_383649 [Lentithecium fluviatile CBS 122367]|uniref:Uncharacterized protein n=1 Tax=Lentithecium fluviatile CBS 122367 TaxID=1168545 RepID=A0A6G1JJ12_9PLEO|nr:hypothetical protein K458DRAFT_383649 [Lentithecium fluviatile CBS 122367]
MFSYCPAFPGFTIQSTTYRHRRHQPLPLGYTYAYPAPLDPASPSNVTEPSTRTAQDCESDTNAVNSENNGSASTRYGLSSTPTLGLATKSERSTSAAGRLQHECIDRKRDAEVDEVRERLESIASEMETRHEEVRATMEWEEGWSEFVGEDASSSREDKAEKGNDMPTKGKGTIAGTSLPSLRHFKEMSPPDSIGNVNASGRKPENEGEVQEIVELELEPRVEGDWVSSETLLDQQPEKATPGNGSSKKRKGTRGHLKSIWRRMTRRKRRAKSKE